MTTNWISRNFIDFVTAATALLVRCGVLRCEVLVWLQNGGWEPSWHGFKFRTWFSSGIFHSHSLNSGLPILLGWFLASIYSGITLHIGALCVLYGPVLQFFLRSTTLLIFGGITGALCCYGLEGCFQIWMDDLRLCLDQCWLMPIFMVNPCSLIAA